ncbi:MAG: hypothetical protein AAFQ82_21870, partial [Myxococcota bacterium]
MNTDGFVHRNRVAISVCACLVLVWSAQYNPFFDRTLSLFAFEPVLWLGLVPIAVWRNWVAACFSGVWIAMFRVFGLAEQGCTHYLHRSFELINDIRLVPALEKVMTNTGGHGTIVLVGVFLGLYLLLAVGFSRVSVIEPRAPIPVFLVLAVSGAVFQFAPLSVRWGAELASVANPEALEEKILVEQERVAAAWPNEPDARWRKRDVHVVLIESYGETVLRHPLLGSVREQTLPRFERELEKEGLVVVSRLLRSPTFGGRSWLAHASIDGGTMITDSLRYERLFWSDIVPLARHFRDAGYATSSVAAGVTEEWPDGKYLAYEFTHYRDQLAYDGGRKFGWGHIPDQWTFEHAWEQMAKEDRPGFTEWHLVSTHVPFAEHPPVLPWGATLAPQVYKDVEVKTFPIEWPYMRDAHAG